MLVDVSYTQCCEDPSLKESDFVHNYRKTLIDTQHPMGRGYHSIGRAILIGVELRA